MQGAAFLITFLAILLLPGLVVSLRIKSAWIQQSGFLFILGFSYSLFVAIVGVSQQFQIAWDYVFYLVMFIISLSLGMVVKNLYKIKHSNALFEIIKTNKVPVALTVLVSAYHFIASIYNEIPSDIYAHLGYFQSALELQNQGSMGRDFGLKFFMQKGAVWYHLLAFCSKVSGADMGTVVYVTTGLTKVLFVLGVYFFSLRIFETSKDKKLIAIIAALFAVLHMGINVMAYIRYYSFAPTMLNFVLYFSAVVAFLSLIKERSVKSVVWQSAYIVTLILASAAIHTQEALFIIVMLALIVLVYVVLFLPAKKAGEKMNWERCFPQLILFCTVFGFCVAYALARNSLDRAPNNDWRLWEFGVLADWLPQLTTLNLKHQFIRVVTLWGLLVYVAAIFYWRDIRKNVFLVAGLISPIFTILNPFFVDLFLRLDNSTTLWRMSYLIPLHFVAAFLVVKIVNSYRNGSGSFTKKIAGSIFILLSIALLLPLKNTYADMHYSRFPTLMPVNAENSFEHLRDAIVALDGIPLKYKVLTDPVTGYVISGMTHHHAYRHKFFRVGYLDFTFENYDDFPLRRHKGKLLLTNKRSNAISDVGAISKHWPKDILNVERYYTQALFMHLQSNPGMFSLLWESKEGDMRLYKIL